jgi:hypothetical protein
MKKKKWFWLLSIALIVSGSPIVSAQDNRQHQRGENWKQESQRHLIGTWYANGERDKRAEIFSSRRGLQARNERGKTTRLDVTRSGNVRAIDWEGKLRGDVKRNRIEWENGTTWTREPNRRIARR